MSGNDTAPTNHNTNSTLVDMIVTRFQDAYNGEYF